MYQQVRSIIQRMRLLALPLGALGAILVSGWSLAHAQTGNSRAAKDSPPHLNQKLEQIQTSFNATASRERVPYRLAKNECGKGSQPVCVYHVLEGGVLNDRLFVVAYGTPNRNLVKVTLLFMNNEATKMEGIRALITFGVLVRLFSPDLDLEGRAELGRTLVDGFAKNGEQATTVGGITYRTTRATAKGGLLFVIQRGET